ncbi:MAG: alginate export family protein [Gammaproteobacteria bacterium]|nr:alginate export family protein [Gammaproteobacteria bacterium]
MDRKTIGALVATALLSSTATLAVAEEVSELGAALTSGKVGVNVRARYENVDQDTIADSADALTARLRLNYRTASWNGLTGFIEYDHVFHLLSDFNSGGGTSPGKSNYPVVADPKGSDLNQLYFDYSFSEKTKGRFGRQRILLDNQRFVGGVGWRQNEQTYDAVTFTSSAIDKAKLHYSYIGNVRRIFGDNVAAGRNNVDTHLLNAKIALSDAWSVTPYYYLIDNDDVTAFSTSTVGARAAGSLSAGDGKLALVAEFAAQSDAGDNPVSYDAEYAHLSGLWSASNGLSLGLAYESLGTDTAALQSFRTPLATLHAFQGWADQFLSTPALGVEDLFVTAKFKAGKWNLTGVYHDFSSASGGIDYGTEIDVSAATKISQNYSILFKGAFFSSDSIAFVDTNKFWIMFTANY